MERRQRPTEQVCLRFLAGDRERIRLRAEQLFQGKDVMVIRDAVETYLDLRDALGFDFDRIVQPLRVREVEAVS